MAPGTARGILRRGRAIVAMPCTSQAWRPGVGADHVDLLADAASNGRGDLFVRDEALLVNHCLELTWGQAVKAVRYWTFRADSELDREGRRRPAHCVWRRRWTGTPGEFTLDPIGGATFTEASSIERDLYRADQRTAWCEQPNRWQRRWWRWPSAHRRRRRRRRPEPLCASSPASGPSGTCASCREGS